MFCDVVFLKKFHWKSAAIARTVGHLSKSAEVMKLVNNLMKAPQMAATMQEFSKEMTKVSTFNGFLLSLLLLIIYAYRDIEKKITPLSIIRVLCLMIRSYVHCSTCSIFVDNQP